LTDALTLRDVTKRYGDFTAVDRLSMSVRAGQIVGFLGPNGAGKTTTIRMIMSILYPDSGEISVLGQPRAIDVKDRIGYLPEERGLYRKMTVDHTLRYFGKLKGLHGRALRRRIGECLESVGLQDWRHKRVEALSKGMSQKLQFIATVLHSPELVILDEPFAGLDPLNLELLKDLVVDLRQQGATVIFSTHQMEQAQRLCDRLVLINRGRKLVEGTMEEIRSRFASRILLLEGEGDFAALASFDGVLDAHFTAGHARLEIAADADPERILRRALDLARLSRYGIQRPDLHEIFVKLVGDDAAPGNGPDAGRRDESARRHPDDRSEEGSGHGYQRSRSSRRDVSSPGSSE
jgi:ABC-2 type transport system ATP-binding protein